MWNNQRKWTTYTTSSAICPQQSPARFVFFLVLTAHATQDLPKFGGKCVTTKVPNQLGRRISKNTATVDLVSNWSKSGHLTGQKFLLHRHRLFTMQSLPHSEHLRRLSDTKNQPIICVLFKSRQGTPQISSNDFGKQSLFTGTWRCLPDCCSSLTHFYIQEHSSQHWAEFQRYCKPNWLLGCKLRLMQFDEGW